MNRVSVLGAGSERMRKCPGTSPFITHQSDSHITRSSQVTAHLSWDVFLTTDTGHTAHARAIYASR